MKEKKKKIKSENQKINPESEFKQNRRKSVSRKTRDFED